MDGRQIRAARERRGWTQQELASRLRVGYKTVGNWERGATVPLNRMGMLRQVFGDEVQETRVESPLAGLSDLDLLSELVRRTIDREARRAPGQ